MKITRALLLQWSMKAIVFLLRGAGGAAFGIFVGFIVSYFFRFSSGKVIDAFALTESMLGIVITGLAIVGAFIVALQWSTLDRKIDEFNDSANKSYEKLTEISKNIDEYVESTVDGYKDKIDYLDKLLNENAKVANETNSRIEEYKSFFIEEMKEQNKVITEKQKELEEKERCFEEKQAEFGKIVHESRKLIEKAIGLQAGSEKMELTTKLNGQAKGEEG